MKEHKHTVYLSLGSNVGNKRQNIKKAIELIKGFSIIINMASLYKTAPLYLKDQNDFLNTVICIETEINPKKLLKNIQIIEKKLLREKTVLNGPRTIDIDILYYDDIFLNEPQLNIPHPKIKERNFVLVPLKEIADKSDNKLIQKALKTNKKNILEGNVKKWTLKKPKN